MFKSNAFMKSGGGIISKITWKILHSKGDTKGIDNFIFKLKKWALNFWWVLIFFRFSMKTRY